MYDPFSVIMTFKIHFIEKLLCFFVALYDRNKYVASIYLQKSKSLWKTYC